MPRYKSTGRLVVLKYVTVAPVSKKMFFTVFFTRCSTRRTSGIPMELPKGTGSFPRANVQLRKVCRAICRGCEPTRRKRARGAFVSAGIVFWTNMVTMVVIASASGSAVESLNRSVHTVSWPQPNGERIDKQYGDCLTSSRLDWSRLRVAFCALGGPMHHPKTHSTVVKAATHAPHV